MKISGFGNYGISVWMMGGRILVAGGFVGGGGGSVGVSGGGGRVSTGEGTGVFVGNIMIAVFVGTMRVLVEVGLSVGGIAVDVLVFAGLGALVRGVKVGIKVGVGLGVRVMVGVAVGRVGVNVGVSEGVTVGAVEVGNGPNNAPAVSARAVLVLFASPCGSASLPKERKRIVENNIKPISRARPTSICK